LISGPGVSDIDQGARVQPIHEPTRVRAVVEQVSKSASQSLDAIPQTFFFGGMHDDVLQLRRPIPLRSERNTGGISVVWEEVSEFGHGDTFSEAVEDFGRTIFELYRTLLRDEVALGEDLLSVRRKLEDYISVRPR
jgi:hypothetical protein